MTTIAHDLQLPEPTGHTADGTPYWETGDGDTLTPTSGGIQISEPMSDSDPFLEVEQDVDLLERVALAMLAAVRAQRRITGGRLALAGDAGWPQVASPQRAAELAAPAQVTGI